MAAKFPIVSTKEIQKLTENANNKNTSKRTKTGLEIKLKKLNF